MFDGLKKLDDKSEKRVDRFLCSAKVLDGTNVY